MKGLTAFEKRLKVSFESDRAGEKREHEVLKVLGFLRRTS
jgi:hypothetical protein